VTTPGLGADVNPAAGALRRHVVAPGVCTLVGLFRIQSLRNQPRYLPNGNIAMLTPAPVEQLTANYQFDTGWRTKMERGRN
jgi:hypothetical protein